jgi:hypothetical protein
MMGTLLLLLLSHSATGKKTQEARGFLRCKTMWMHSGRTLGARPWVYRQKATLLCARQQQAVGHAATRMLLQLQRRMAQTPSGQFSPS